MAEMNTPGAGQSSETVAVTPPQNPSATQAKQKTVKAAENVREKTHEYAESARAGIEQAVEAIEKAPDYAHKAEEFIHTAEQRLDELINTAEKVLAKGTEYTATARSWMNDHPEYRKRAEKILTKATEYRNRLSAKMSERSAAMRGEGGESTAEHLRAQGHEAVEKGKEALERGLEKGKEVFKGNRVSMFVKNNPTDTLMVGTALGVIVGTVVKHSRGSAHGV